MGQRIYVSDGVIKAIAEECAAEIVKHGKWGKFNKNSNLFVCSECGGQPPFYKNNRENPVRTLSTYCPHCGAKMDLESGD